MVSLYRCVLPPRPLIPDLCSDLGSSSNHLIGKTVFPLSPYIPLPHQIGTSLISSLGLDPGLWPPSRRKGGGQSDTLADRPRRRSEGSGPAAAKVQPVPGGPCQLELFLEAMFANSVLIVSLSKLWLPGLREGESLRNPPSLLVRLLFVTVLLLTGAWDQWGTPIQVRALPSHPSTDTGQMRGGRGAKGGGEAYSSGC